MFHFCVWIVWWDEFYVWDCFLFELLRIRKWKRKRKLERIFVEFLYHYLGGGMLSTNNFGFNDFSSINVFEFFRVQRINLPFLFFWFFVFLFVSKFENCALVKVVFLSNQNWFFGDGWRWMVNGMSEEEK